MNRQISGGAAPAPPEPHARERYRAAVDFTRLSARQLAFDLGVVSLVGFVLVLVAVAFLRQDGGRRFGPVWAAPLGGALAVGVLALALWGGDVFDVPDRLSARDGRLFRLTGSRGLSVLVVLASVAAGMITADFVVHRLVRPAVGAAARRGPPWAHDAVAWTLFLAVAAVAGLGLTLARPPEALGGRGTFAVDIEARYALDGWPLAGAMVDGTSGYLSIYPDRIVRFELPHDGQERFSVNEVADGLRFPHGLAIDGDTLFVTETGPLLCDDPGLVFCVPAGMTAHEAELATIEGSAGRVLAFPIEGDELGAPQAILSDLPVVSHQHALNALEPGPDGRLYMAIGGLGVLGDRPEQLASVDRPDLNLLGTVVSFEPDGSDFVVVARGLRNPYDLAWGPDGRLYSVDNDGMTAQGFRAEEVVAITHGAHFGFPFEGTFDPPELRTEPPLWALPGDGTAAVAWVDLGEREYGLLIGQLFVLRMLRFDAGEDGALRVARDDALDDLLAMPGYATFVAALPGGEWLVAQLGTGGAESELLVLSLR